MRAAFGPHQIESVENTVPVWHLSQSRTNDKGHIGPTVQPNRVWQRIIRGAVVLGQRHLRLVPTILKCRAGFCAQFHRFYRRISPCDRTQMRGVLDILIKFVPSTGVIMRQIQMG